MSNLSIDQREINGLALLKELTKSQQIALIDLDEGTTQIRLSLGIDDSDKMFDRISESAKLVSEQYKARVDHYKINGNQIALVSVPLLERNVIRSCVSLVVPNESSQAKLDELMTTVQLFAVHFYGMEAERERRKEQRASIRIAGYIEATEKAVSSEDFPECAAHLVESFRDLADCTRVALATRRFGQIQIQAISGVPSSETMRSSGATAMESLLKKALVSDQEIMLESGSGSLSIPEMSTLGADKLFCAPLKNRGKNVGAWLYIWKTQPDDIDERIRFLRTATDLMGSQLSLFRRTKPGVLGGMLRRLWRRANQSQKVSVFMVGAALVVVALFPIPMPIKAKCTLEPKVRRTVSAPFDGVLRYSLVEPGQRVAKGELIAELDDREVRWNLADTRARILGANKQSDLALSAGQIADSQIAKLEADSLLETRKVLEYRQQNLQIKSPVNGIVLKGELKDKTGATVRMGETLFEVGELTVLEAEIEVRESDINLVREMAPVKLRFDSKPGASWNEEVVTISPKSEYRDGANVFVCRVDIGNSEGWLRPGGHGDATISGPRRPAVWSILRTPVNWVLQRLP